MKTLKMLGIDLGASSGRGIVGCFDGGKITLRENHRFTNDPVIQNGRFSWDILRIFHEIKNSIRQSVLDGDSIASIGIDTWGVDYGFIDRNGYLLANPVHYRDTRTEGIPEEIDKILPLSEIYAKTGIQSINFNTVYQLYIHAKQNPEHFAQGNKMLFTPDLLGYFLTGKMATEYTIASTGALLDAVKRDYARDILEKLNIPSHIFSDIVFPGYDMGTLLPQVIDEVGQTDAKVLKIASHDTASAVMAVPSKEESFIYISSGTWSLMGTETKAPIINDKSCALNFTNEGGAEGTIRFLKNIMGLWILQESRRQWKREGKDFSFGQLSEMAAAVPCRRSLINPEDKRFGVPGNMPRRIAEFCRETNQPVPESEGEIVRCILDSLALKYRETVENIAAFTPKAPAAIHIVGGGSQDKLLCRAAADACDLPVYAGPVEATAIGNICAQAIALGELKDLSEARDVVSHSFELVTYEPDNSEKSAWDEAFERFKKLI